jgi:LacI family transcriptional regulator
MHKTGSPRSATLPPRILVGFRLVEALRDFLDGIGAYLRANELEWQIQCVDAEQFATLLKPSSADGAIAVVGTKAREQIRRLRRSKIPAINLLQDLSPAIPSIMSDDDGIGSAAAAHLLSCGFRHFAYLGFDASWSVARETAFGAALSAAGHAFSPCEQLARASFGDLKSNRTMRVLRRWIAALPKPVAVLACSDTVARVLLTACESESIRVPDEVAILGVDNLVATCELSNVTLSSVAQNFSRMGFEAARRLHQLMIGRRPPKRAELIPPGPIVVRRSTSVLVFRDEYVSTAMKLISERAREGISVDEVLRAIPVSRRWLDERFSVLVGRTVSHEIRHRRAAAVRDLLLQTDLSVKQIARRCGFPSPENLIRFFRDAYGLPPNAYRVKHAIPG